ncbi:hypothetical protein MZK49_06950 [Ensifer sesbaniae]|uniref:hypothetical protein n=1 Tax=Ensifer sesbaniae TaxID=1214071 RepID=UPI002001889B|nr:hypothetical protein [Ensifer sesbaniae]
MAKQPIKTSEDQDKREDIALLSIGEEEYQKRFPLTLAALKKLEAEDADPSKIVLRVTAKSAGFRRGGMSHPATATDHPLSDFRDPAVIEAILSEAELVAEITTAESKPAETPDAE